MKLSKVEFRRYKRLHETACNVDGRTIAFIGPNEAGKSSVLLGLQWLTSDTTQPLDKGSYSRRTPPEPKETIVRAHYKLEESDFQALQALDTDSDLPIDSDSVTEFRMSRTVEGVLQTGIGSTLKRNRKPFESLASGLRLVRTALDALRNVLDPQDLSEFDEILSALELDTDVDELDSVRLQSNETLLRELFASLDFDAPPLGKHKKLEDRIQKLLSLVEAAIVAADRDDPQDAVRHALRKRVPKFLLFSDEDRILDPNYNLADESVRTSPAAPLRNLLAVARTSVDELWGAIEQGVIANLRTLERRLNETLKARIGPMWTQSKLSIELKINVNGLLEVNIVELDSPDFTVTPIAERSDGLRAFLALVCFLIAAELESPPVLLIDEAERNLHYDAQADLIRVLTRDLVVSKVIYTTHSPGCLPLDLGTGIRVVSRDEKDGSVSALLNNFWTDSEPGFSRLLFAMGAQVASFSAFRRAVLAEGVSEMILLPTLMRNATNGLELDFQVAFGLSNMSAPSALGTVALRTTFLVDGDASGDTKSDQLEAAGFPRSHIFKLPRNKAIEDLVDRKTYLDEVDRFLKARNGQILDRSQLSAKLTLARAVDEYCRKTPEIGRDVSHKVIASRLAELGEDLKLSPLGLKVLPDLRSRLEAALNVPYQVPQD